MKRWIAVALLLAWASGAQGQTADGGRMPRTLTGTGTVQGVVRADSSAKTLTTDVDGNLKVVDSDRDRNKTIVQQSIIQADSLPAAGDSSAVITLNGMRHLVLLVRGYPISSAAANNQVSRIAVQIRTHLNGQSDSASTFVVPPLGSTVLGAATTAPFDTIAFGHMTTGSTSAAWSGEFVVQIDRLRIGPSGSASNTLYWPSGVAIPLDGLFGRDLWLPNISVRVRLLSGPKVGNLRVHLIGSAL